MKKFKGVMFNFTLLAFATSICLSAGAAFAVCPDGISAYWGLDETAGPDYFDAIGLNDGVGAAAPTATTEGRVDGAGAQVFDSASNTSIDVTESHTFNWLNTDSFSIELWVKTNGQPNPGTQVFIGREEEASGMQWWIGQTTAGLASFLIRDQTGGSTLSAVGVATRPNINDGLWHHIVFVRDASSVPGELGANTFYVDNVEIISTPQNFPAGLVSATADLNIGRMDVAGIDDFYFDGVIDEVALYDRALTVNEINDHFIAGNSGTDICEGSFSIDAPYPENTISFWNLDETAGPDYFDAIGLNDGVGAAAPTATTEGRVDGAGAQVFDSASNTSIDVTESHTFNWLNTDSFSIELWVKTNGQPNPGTQVFIGREEEASGMQWWIGQTTAGLASFLIRDQTGGSTLSAVGVATRPNINDGLWHHIVFVRDASSVPGELGANTFYVDNVEIISTPQNFPAGLVSATADLNIGRMDVAGIDDFYFDGVIDEVALYDRALTVGEIDDHFNAGDAGLSVTSLRPEPVADAGANQSVSAGADVTLDGTGSSDADGTIVTYQWEQTDGTGTSVTLSGATSDTATFDAPATSSILTLTFRLTVTDNDGFSSTDDTSVTVNPGSSVVPAGGGGGGGGCFISSIF